MVFGCLPVLSTSVVVALLSLESPRIWDFGIGMRKSEGNSAPLKSLQLFLVERVDTRYNLDLFNRPIQSATRSMAAYFP